MKKIFYLIAAIVTSNLAYSQSQSNITTLGRNAFVPVENANQNPSKITPKGERGTSFWSNDFSTPGDWIYDNQSTPAVDWSIVTDVNAPPAGAGLNPVGLTSAANGYALINGDIMGDGSVQDSNIKFANSIDLSLVDNVGIQFEQVTRNWASTYSFIFSLDGGATWTEVPVNTGLAVNTNTANPELYFQNVSQYIANQSDVRIGFNFSADWGWFWAIDEVALVEVLENDLAVVEGWYDEWLIQWDDAEATDYELAENFESSTYKTGQVRPLTFMADVINNGSLAQTGATLKITLQTPSGTEEFESAGVTINPLETVRLMIPDVTPAAFAGMGTVGDYVVSYEVYADVEDNNPANNVLPDQTFAVNTDYMSNDAGAETAGRYTDTQDQSWMNRSFYVEETTLNYISFALYDDTQPGEVVFLNLYNGSPFDVDGPNNPQTYYFGETDIDYVVDESELTTATNTVWITLMLPEVVDVPENSIISAEVYCPASDPPVIAIAAAPSSVNSNSAGLVFDFADATYSWLANLPLIRAGFDSEVGIDGPADHNFKISQNYPNPSNGNTRIDWELLVPAKNVQFTISDVTGKTVYAKDLGDRPAGVQEPIELNLNLASGNYQYGLTIGNQRIVRKMVVTK